MSSAPLQIAGTSSNTEQCVGCGAIVPRMEGPIHPYMTSAPGCWAMHGELSARHLSDPTAVRYRQLCVDAYAVQHPGTPGPQAIQSVALHLVSLHAQLERGFSLRQAMRLIQSGTQLKGRFAWLTPPSFSDALTIADMLEYEGDPAIGARDWAQSAWTAWTPHHDQVRIWYELLMRGR